MTKQRGFSAIAAEYSGNDGFSLIELLLVLVCMAAIIAWSMHHYQQDQRRSETLQVQSDIKSLQRALDTYFHAVGCDNTGAFANSSGAVTVPVDCETLKSYGDVVCVRPPLVSQYAAQLIKTDQTTTSIPAKPIYQLEVQAVMASNLTANQIIWYQQQLQAKANPAGSTLIWDSLPTNSNVQFGDKSWILNGAGSFFRATENQRGSGGATPPEYSGSFCAN